MCLKKTRGVVKRGESREIKRATNAQQGTQQARERMYKSCSPLLSKKKMDMKNKIKKIKKTIPPKDGGNEGGLKICKCKNCTKLKIKQILLW